jgi:spermidine synthase
MTNLYWQVYPTTRFIVYISLGLICLSGAISASGLIPETLPAYLHLYHEGNLTVALGVPGYYLLSYGLATKPSRKELLYGLVIGAIITIIIFMLFPFHGRTEFYSGYIATLPGTVFGAVALVYLLAKVMLGRLNTGYLVYTDMLAASLAIIFAAPAIGTLLQITTALHPASYDPAAFRTDALLGFQPSVLYGLLAQRFPFAQSLLNGIYSLLPLALAALFARQVSLGYRGPVHMLVFQLVAAIAAIFFVYHLAPVAGPAYLFHAAFPGSAFLPAAMPDLAVTAAVPRNGMPSMHFGWALALWLNAYLIGAPRLRVFYAAFAALTLVATLATGQHYLVDLAASPPFILFLQALCTRGLPALYPARLKWMGVGMGLTLFWIIIVRHAGHPLDLIPGGMWLAMIASTAVSLYFWRDYIRFVRGPGYDPEARQAWTGAAEGHRSLAPVAALFFFSGLAALIYEVTFAKKLALTFGSTATATYTVLAIYMGGMALGAWLGGVIAERSRRPLLLYAYAELAIGVYCAATPWLFDAVQSVYVSLAAGYPPDHFALLPLRIVLGGAVLAIPTLLMGVTLPILVAHFNRQGESIGAGLGWLYGANTLGAAFGALCAGYWIIPALGLHGTMLVAVLTNLLVALLAMKRFNLLPPAASQPVTPDPESRRGIGSDLAGWPAYLLLGVGGVITLAIEVDYIHMLAVVAGNSTYAFSLMLFTFLLGLGVGAELARRALSSTRFDLALSLAWLELLLAGVLLVGLSQWDNLPAYFGSYVSYPMGKGFGAREFIRGAVCWVVMFPPALLIGAIYPIAMEWVGRANPDHPVRAIGTAAAINTLGNITGVLLAGFVLLPHIGAFLSIQVLAVVCALLGLFMLAWYQGQHRLITRLVPVAGMAAFMTVQPAQPDYTAIASGANVYFRPLLWGRAIDHAESLDGGLTTVMEHWDAQGGQVKILLTNGKFQGNDAMSGEMVAQSGFALTPMLHTPARQSALVIGYGTGVTPRTFHDAGFGRVDIAESSADDVDMANRHFAKVNERVSELPGVALYISDGRNFLLLQNKTYDLISMDVTPIWFAGAGSLYNREFYESAKKRLTPDGVLQQRVQLHHTSQEDLMYILGSARAEFRYVWLYVVGGQGMIIASNSVSHQPSKENAILLDQCETLKPLLRLQAGNTAVGLLNNILLRPENVDKLLSAFGTEQDYWVSTDDNLFLEYDTPKGNALPDEGTIQTNVEFLRMYGGA